MEIKVSGCGDCPFYNYIDVGSLGGCGECLLARHLEMDGIIDLPWGSKVVPEDVPSWCPLEDGDEPVVVFGLFTL